MSDTDAAFYLRTADELLGGSGTWSVAVAVAGGWWPNACACLTRLGLEAAIDEFWQRREPAVAACTARRTQLLMLRRYAGRDVARRASYTWGTLSRLTHYQCYDTRPAAQELRRLHTGACDVVASLDHQRANPTKGDS